MRKAMFRARLLGLSLRSAACRTFRSSANPRPGFRPCRTFPSRSYTKSTNYKDQRLAKTHLQDDESLLSWPWHIYAIPTALLALVAAGTFIHYNDKRRAIRTGSEAGTISQGITRPAIGGPFELFNVDNQSVTDADLRGSWTLVYFGYTSSPDVGPEEVQKMAKAIHILESEHNLKVKPIFITIDPQRDSPDQLRAYLKEFDPRIEGLTGSVAAIRHAAQEYRVYFKKVGEEGQDYLIESSNNMYLLDPNAQVVKIFGVEYDESRLSDAIVKEVKQASK